MNRIEARIKNIFIERGIMLENWKLKITNIEGESFSDYRNVTTEVFKPRCRKPCITWVLSIDIVRGIVNFDKSNFYK